MTVAENLRRPREPFQMGEGFSGSSQIEGSKNPVVRKLERVLAVIPLGVRVAVEGTPIYLNEHPNGNHDFGYDLLAKAWRLLGERKCEVEHHVLVDDYTVEGSFDKEIYLAGIRDRVPVTSVYRESDFAAPAKEILSNLGDRVIFGADGKPISLRTRSGRPACPLLDSLFQAQKRVDFNFILHPIEFKLEQEAMREVLRMLGGGKLPFSTVNAFFKGGTINKAFITDVEGRTRRIELQ
ncbi:MAG: hypothetical protein Q8P10_02130 [bacterium]|nr:hypothetical protein [bacterium]